MGSLPLQTMFVARRVQLKHDCVGFFRRLRKGSDHFQRVVLVAVDLVAGADPELGSIQIACVMAPVWHRLRPPLENA